MDMENEANPVKKRLKMFIASLGISEREFCRRIGVSSAYVESIKKSVSPKVMQTMSIHYPELNPTWLILGKGEMILDNSKAAAELQAAVTLPTSMILELLTEARTEKAWLKAQVELLNGVVENQQTVISNLTEELKKANARKVEDAGSAAVG